MNIIAIGTDGFIKSSIIGLLESGCKVVALISLIKKNLPDNSEELKSFALSIDVPYFEVTDINSSESEKLLKKIKPDVIFASWPKILKKSILEIPKYGIIGSHPTNLPIGRGRHPLHWQIILGVKKSYLSFFWMNEAVDAGKIILKSPYKILPDDDIKYLLKKVEATALKSAKKIGKLLLNNKLNASVNQSSTKGNVWRKRDRHDVLIDFRMSSKDIIRLINSFSSPYPCAFFLFNENKISCISASVKKIKTKVPSNYIEPGYVLKVKQNKFTIKVADKILEISCKEGVDLLLSPNTYIYPPSKYIINNLSLKDAFSLDK